MRASGAEGRIAHRFCLAWALVSYIIRLQQNYKSYLFLKYILQSDFITEGSVIHILYI